jgi:lipopolysaccharide export system permease protein
MQFLWRYIDDLVGKGLEASVIAELLIYTSSSLVPMALPLAILMASLMTFGNMGEYYELTAIKASGISLQRVMMPLMILIILISIGAFFFANDVLPYTNLKMRSLLYDVRNQRPEIQIVQGIFYNGIEGYSVRVDKKDPATNMLYDVKIYDHSQRRGNTSVIIADSGRMIVTEDERYLIFTLYNGYSYNEEEGDRRARRMHTYPHRYDTFDEQQMIIELVGFSLTRTDENLFRNHYSMLNLNQLNLMADSIEDEINFREQSLARTLIVGNYFKKRQYQKNVRTHFTKTPDSIKFFGHKDMQRDMKIFADTGPPVNRALLFGFGDPSEPEETMNDTINSDLSDNPDASNTGYNDPLPPKQDMETVKQASAEYYDSLMAKLTFKEKEALLREALTYAKSTRTYVSNNLQSIKTKIKRLRRFEVETQRKFTIAFSCFVFLLIGAPLGAIIRKGGLGLPLVLSTLFFIFYYIISLMGEKFVRESILPDYQGMWISTIVFFTAGSFLTYKATTDAAILNIDTYANLLKKIPGFKRESIMEVLEKQPRIELGKRIKHEKIVASLSSFRETIGELNEDVNTRIKFTGYLLSLIGLREISNIILFERLYKNIIYSIRQSDLFEDQAIRTKLNEFPNFRYRNYVDQKGILFIRLILLLIPPVTLIVLVRHYVQFLMLKGRLQNIDQLTEDLIILVKRVDLFNK